MRTHSQATGFTLIEILVVVVILGILAAIVVPQFTTAADESRRNSARMDLHRIRQQLALYKQQHGGEWPSLERFEQQLTLASKSDHSTARDGTAGYTLGPYLQHIPSNPFTNTRSIDDGPVGSTAWYYNPATGEFRLNDTEEHRRF